MGERSGRRSGRSEKAGDGNPQRGRRQQRGGGRDRDVQGQGAGEAGLRRLCADDVQLDRPQLPPKHEAISL